MPVSVRSSTRCSNTATGAKGFPPHSSGDACHPDKVLHMEENLQARQIKSGRGGTPTANMLCDLQSVVLSEIWWSKQIGCWVLSSQQPWKYSSVDGEGRTGGAFSFREGTSAQISFYLHHSNFFFTFMLHVQICSKTMLTCNFPTREKEKKTKHVLMFNANHKISRWVFTGKIQSFLFIFCSLLFLKLVS